MSLNNDTRQNIQSNLDFSTSPTGEARRAGREGSESLRTTSVPESPARTDRMMEEIVERENLKEALRRVKANKGAPGVDGMTVNQLDDHLKQHWPAVNRLSLKVETACGVARLILRLVRPKMRYLVVRKYVTHDLPPVVELRAAKEKARNRLPVPGLSCSDRAIARSLNDAHGCT